MTRAPEAVDKLVETAGEVVGEVARQTRRTRRELARKAKSTRKDLTKTAKKARKSAKETVAHLTGNEPKRRRRWPWILGLAVAAAGTAAVVKSRSGGQEEVFTPEPRSEDEKPTTEPQGNGQPQPAKPAAQPKK